MRPFLVRAHQADICARVSAWFAIGLISPFLRFFIIAVAKCLFCFDDVVEVLFEEIHRGVVRARTLEVI